jgi:uncharacterized protein (TIGR03067 family)
MMKAAVVAFVASAALLLGGQADEKALKKEQTRLQGTWKIVRLQTPKGDDDNFKDGTLVLEKDGTLELKVGGETKKGTYKINPAGKPKEIDISPDGDANKVMKGIYQLDKDKLKICVTEDPNGNRPTEFEAKEGGAHALATLERVKQ